MNIVVQKFGGTSVQTDETRKVAASHVKRAVFQGKKVVVVVSAMGRKGDPYATDTLLGLIRSTAMKEMPRERDMLLSCGEIISAVVFTDLLCSVGLKAMALTGFQAGITTDDTFGEARIVDVDTTKIMDLFSSDYEVIVVAGFQGKSRNDEITTLGRGGSDTSATALASSLHAEYVDIYTDVEGVMTADPRIVSNAVTIRTVTYEEICNFAYQGAKVIHPRAVEIAMQNKIPIYIRSLYKGEIGTTITDQKGVKERLITGVAHLSHVTQITVKGEASVHLQKEVFDTIAKADISVDFINIQPKLIRFTVSDEQKDRAITLLRHKGYEPEAISGCAKVSAVGAGMTGVPGVAAKIATALANEGIEILQSADSHTTIWVLIKGDDMEKAVLRIHEAFDLANATFPDGRQAKERGESH